MDDIFYSESQISDRLLSYDNKQTVTFKETFSLLISKIWTVSDPSYVPHQTWQLELHSTSYEE